MTHDIRAASSLGLERLAALFTAAYAGYVIPFQVDVPALRFMIDAFDLDLDASRVAFVADEPVALANLGVRGDAAWIGGIGVVPSARRQGLADRLMNALADEARARGVTSIWLEVMVENDPAVRLYEKLGYRVMRELEVWTLESGGAGGSADEIPVEAAKRAIATGRAAREPWQRSDGTVSRLDSLHALGAGEGVAILRTANERTSLLQFAGDAEAARTILETARSQTPVTALNLVAGSTEAHAFASLDGKLVVSQLEMVLPL